MDYPYLSGLYMAVLGLLLFLVALVCDLICVIWLLLAHFSTAVRSPGPVGVALWSAPAIAAAVGDAMAVALQGQASGDHGSLYRCSSPSRLHSCPS